MAKILIADDQFEILHALKLLLKQEGFQTVMATSPQGVVEEAAKTAFDLILIDLNYTRDTTSGREGLDLIAHLRAMPHAAPIIVMTAWSTVPLAVEAMRLGAADFIEKPWDNRRLLALIEQHMNPHQPSPNESRPRQGLTAAADLEIARSVQTRLLPQHRPGLATLDYAVQYQPAGAVGGDYYDFLPAGDGSIAFVVADVSGKGISAAILMATIQSFFRSRDPEAFRDLPALVRALNHLFFHSSPPEHYATLFLMRYSEPTREVEWLNCGHTAPLLAQCGALLQLDSSATVLGMFAEWTGAAQRFTLDPDDTLLIFSDGLVEATDKNHQEFGEERLLASWPEWRELGPANMVETIARAIRTHTHGPMADDLTIVALRGVAAQSPVPSDDREEAVTAR